MQSVANDPKQTQASRPRASRPRCAAERLASWRAAAQPLRAKRDAITAELAKVYPEVVNRLVDILTRAQEIDAATSRLSAAPDGTGAVAKVGGTEMLRELTLPRWGDSPE